MRGALQVRQHALGLHGIIPADAGSTTGRAGTRLHSQDHPRGCGEHVACAVDEAIRLGSSPRMRGAPKVLENIRQYARIIPADAGST